MVRTCLRVLLSTLLLLSWQFQPLVAGENPDRKQQAILAVQVALDQGQQCLQQGDYVGAVAILEKQLPYIDGNRRYLHALRDAYRGLVRQLDQAGKTAEARRYRGFLEILETPDASSREADTPLANRSAPVSASPARTEVQPLAVRVPEGITPRGKVEEDDPFADSNRVDSLARSLLQRAERAFQTKNYSEAAQLYKKANQLEPSTTAVCLERWNYCELYCIAQRLNQGEAVEDTQARQYIEKAIQQTPRLERFGRILLDRLASAGNDDIGTVEIRHTPRQQNGWAIAETANFRVYHTLQESEADRIIRIAEHTRVRMTRKWFGEEPQNWSPRCEVFIHANGGAYAKATGAPANAPGHSTISLESGRILSRRIDLRGDDPNLTIGVLPHETTHVVLAGRFGTHHVPRWADEGIAVLSEPRNRIELHLRNLANFQRDRNLFSVQELMRQEDYPHPQRIGPFYAQSVSVVEFLVQKRDPQTFIRFVRAALDAGRYDRALQTYYGYASFAELERDWYSHAFGSGVVARTAEKRTR